MAWSNWPRSTAYVRGVLACCDEEGLRLVAPGMWDVTRSELQLSVLRNRWGIFSEVAAELWHGCTARPGRHCARLAVFWRHVSLSYKPIIIGDYWGPSFPNSCYQERLRHSLLANQAYDLLRPGSVISYRIRIRCYAASITRGNGSRTHTTPLCKQFTNSQILFDKYPSPCMTRHQLRMIETGGAPTRDILLIRRAETN